MHLKTLEKHDLAAYSLAIDSEREMVRSILVPLGKPYQKVTNYLSDLYDPSGKKGT